MAIKRKFDRDTVAESDRCVGSLCALRQRVGINAHTIQSKQLRLVPFPSYQADADVAMSDASSDVSPVEPIITEQHHMRLDSGVSTASSSDYGDGVYLVFFAIGSEFISTHIAPALPSFSFHPNPFFGPDGSVDPDSHNFSRYSVSPPPQKSVGLLEPKNSSFHHGLVSSPGLLLVSGCSNLC